MMKKTLLILVLFFLCAGYGFAQTKVANDPSRIGVGARPLGIGKAYLGLGDDVNSMFINPAGLSMVKDNWQVTSMSGKFVNEVNYFNFGGAYPTGFGTFGIGYVGSNVGFTAPSATTEVVDGVIRIIPSGAGVSYTYNNNAALLSYGTPLRGLLGWDIFQKGIGIIPGRNQGRLHPPRHGNVRIIPGHAVLILAIIIIVNYIS